MCIEAVIKTVIQFSDARDIDRYVKSLVWYRVYHSSHPGNDSRISQIDSTGKQDLDF